MIYSKSLNHPYFLALGWYESPVIFVAPLWHFCNASKKSPDRIVLDLRIAPLWCKRQGGFALRGRGWKVESKKVPGRWGASEMSIEKWSFSADNHDVLVGGKRSNLSSFILQVRRKTHFFTCFLWVFLSEICDAITTGEAFTRSVSAISQNANLKTGERQMSASNPMHSSGNSHPLCLLFGIIFSWGFQ